MGSFDQERYDAANGKAHAFFHSMESVHSPLLGEIHFTSDGFMHLLFEDEERKEKRDWKNQMKRFELLPHVPHILKNMTHCQEYFEVMRNVSIKMNKQRMTTMKIVRYWGFVAIIKNYQRRVKIVIRQIGDGKVHFWSIIPYWKTTHYKDVIRIVLSKGDLVRD